MSKSYRLYCAAVGGCIAASFLWAVPSQAQGRPAKESVGQQTAQRAGGDQKAPSDDADAAFWKDKTGDASVYRDICKKPKDKEYADLCQQWRQSEAAEKQAQYAGLQFWASLFGVVGLIVTIVYTHSAISLSRKTAKYQLRPYVSITPKSVMNWRVDTPTHRFAVQFELNNRGETVALDLTFKYSMVIAPVPLPEDYVWPANHADFNFHASLFPDEPLPAHLFNPSQLEPGDWAKIEGSEWRMHIRGMLLYEDAFGDRRTTEFSFSFGGPGFLAQTKKIPGAAWSWNYGKNHNRAT